MVLLTKWEGAFSVGRKGVVYLVNTWVCYPISKKIFGSVGILDT